MNGILQSMSIHSPEDLQRDTPEDIRLRLLADAQSLVTTVTENPVTPFAQLAVEVSATGGVTFRSGELETSPMLGIEDLDGAGGYTITTVTRNDHEDGRFDLIRQTSFVNAGDFIAGATTQYFDDDCLTPLSRPIVTIPHTAAYIKMLLGEIKGFEGVDPPARQLTPAGRKRMSRWIRQKPIAS